MAVTTRFGAELQQWRRARRLSQLDLANLAGTTPRHLSFLETGRSRPTATTLGRICDALDIPLAERNVLYDLAALAAPFPTTPISDPTLSDFRHALQQLLSNHDPNPGLAFDRHWNIAATNEAAAQLVGEEINVIESLFHGRWRQLVENWTDVAWSVAARLRRDAAEHPHDDRLAELSELAAGELAATPRPDPSNLLAVCPTFRIGNISIPTIVITARFGSPDHVATDELRVELVYPRNPAQDKFPPLVK